MEVTFSCSICCLFVPFVPRQIEEHLSDTQRRILLGTLLFKSKPLYTWVIFLVYQDTYQLMDWPHPHILSPYHSSLYRLIFCFNFFMNAPMVAMTTQMPVVISLTLSIAMFVRTITHSNHSLKLEIMIAASWPLTVFVFVIHCMTTTDAAGDHHLLYRFRNCCTTNKQTMILFTSFGFTFITPPYTYVFLYPTWVHIQLRRLMLGRRRSMVNTLKSSLFCIDSLSCSPVNTKLFCVPNIAMHALPFRVASMPAVRFDLIEGLLTCL